MNNYEKRDNLQLYLANERTFLAWIRACIALIGLGFIISKFNLLLVLLKSSISQNPYLTQNPLSTTYLQNFRFESLIGLSLILLAVVFIVIALWNYQRIRKSLESGLTYTNPLSVYIVASVVIIISFITIAYLMFLG